MGVMTTLHTTLPFLPGRWVILMGMKVCISVTLLFCQNSSLGYLIESQKKREVWFYSKQHELQRHLQAIFHKLPLHSSSAQSTILKVQLNQIIFNTNASGISSFPYQPSKSGLEICFTSENTNYLTTLGHLGYYSCSFSYHSILNRGAWSAISHFYY